MTKTVQKFENEKPKKKKIQTTHTPNTAHEKAQLSNKWTRKKLFFFCSHKIFEYICCDYFKEI